MTSRRQFLATSGFAVTTGTLGSCLSKVGLAKTGSLQLKGISLTWKYGNRTYSDQPLVIWFDDRDRTISGRYDPVFVGNSVRAPDDVVVSQDRHRKLSTRFTVSYLIGVCGKDFVNREDQNYGCLNTSTSRKDFNRVQLNDRAEVRETDNRFDVIDVYEDAYTVRSTDLRRFDFAKIHEDDGISSERW